MRERPLRFGLVASTALSSPTGGACTVQGVEQEKEKHLHRLPAASIRVENGSGTETEHRANDRQREGA